MNRIKASVLVLFAVYWSSVVAIFLGARDIFDQAVKTSSNRPLAEIGVLFVLTLLLALLSTGVVRGWRWTFWLVLVAFMAGILRVPLGALQLAGYMPVQGPAWYVVFQAVVGLFQFVIAVAMLVGFRKAGTWGGP